MTKVAKRCVNFTITEPFGKYELEDIPMVASLSVNKNLYLF